MRLIFLILFIILIDSYVYQSFQTSIQGLGTNARRLLKIAYWSLPVISVSLILLYEAGYAPWLPKNGGRSVLLAMLILSYICKMMVVPFILLDDIRRIGTIGVQFFQGTTTHMPSRSRFLSTLGLSFGVLPFITLLYGMWRNPYRYKIHQARVPVAGLHPDLHGFKIVQISDIHSGSFNLIEPVENAIRMINNLNPDLVCFTGDLVNNQSKEMQPFIPLFSQIKARLGVYSVLGNHDYGDYFNWDTPQEKETNFQEMIHTHQKLGWKLLRNEHEVLQVGDAKLTVLGVENYSATARFHRYGDLEKSLTGSPADSTKILLSHDPSHWDAQVRDKQKDIVLTMSGHTHGMQFGVEIPGWIKWSPVQYIYKQWAGLYSASTQHLYVNRGLGFLGYPGRVGILPEITLLELEPA